MSSVAVRTFHYGLAGSGLEEITMWKFLVLLSLCLCVSWCRKIPTSTDCTIMHCFVQPCEVTTCPNHPEAICRDDYCGGCFAHFFLGQRQLSPEDCGNVAT